MIDIPSLFPKAAKGPYLNTASIALGNQPAADALALATADWLEGKFDFVAAEAEAEELRSLSASLIGATTADMAIVTGASGAASTVAAQLPDGSNGANVVVPANDFLSNFMPWALLAERGYELRTVDSVNGVLSSAAFAEVADSNTAVIATSLVQSSTGYRVDVDGLKTVAHDVGAWLVLDASQAMGSIEINVDGVDALFSCSHKWLLGIRGMGHLYVSPKLSGSFKPLTPGWKATADPVRSFYGPEFELAERASKLDASFSWFDALANIEGIRIIDGIGSPEIEAHNMGLVEELVDLGIEVPFDPASRSPIVSITVDDPDSAMRNLSESGITASHRAGSLRVAFHVYNTTSDVTALAGAIR